MIANRVLKESELGKNYSDKDFLEKLDIFLINTNLTNEEQEKLIFLFSEVTNKLKYFERLHAEYVIIIKEIKKFRNFFKKK
ncbi:MAG: hypothetical protein PHF86_02380 [Candidatus Nanoarchaeia archaeon]|nr:hypothetical protein [Candidatus Nanoarchaeia archaeon]